MRVSVATEARIWPRSSALRKPTETPVARATCTSERLRFWRRRRNRWPGERTLSAGTETTPDRKSTRLNSSHLVISYAVFCLIIIIRIRDSILLFSTQYLDAVIHDEP